MAGKSPHQSTAIGTGPDRDRSPLARSRSDDPAARSAAEHRNAGQESATAPQKKQEDRYES
jgi:hypothetical protein